MHKARALWFLSIVTVTACGPRSDLNPNQPVSIQGTVLRESGTPYANNVVRLFRYPSLLDAFSDLATLGLNCLTPNGVCSSAFKSATSDTNGVYTFPTITGADAQDSFGTALLFSTLVSGPTAVTPALSSAGVTANFYVQAGNLIIPTQELWEDLPQEADSGGNVTMSWSTAQPWKAANSGATPSYAAVITQGGATVWTSPSNSNVTTFDQRVTQDFNGTWNAQAEVHLQNVENSTWDLTYYTPLQSYASKNHVPLSRGHNCAMVVAQDANATVAANANVLSPCPATDGNMSTSMPSVTLSALCNNPNGCPPAPGNWFYVDLGTSQALSMLVLYNVAVNDPNNFLTNTIQVSGSTDANTWTSIGSTSVAAYQTAPLTGTYRYVKLQLSSPTGQFNSLPRLGNSEIAIY